MFILSNSRQCAAFSMTVLLILLDRMYCQPIFWYLYMASRDVVICYNSNLQYTIVVCNKLILL